LSLLQLILDVYLLGQWCPSGTEWSFLRLHIIFSLQKVTIIMCFALAYGNKFLMHQVSHVLFWRISWYHWENVAESYSMWVKRCYNCV